MRDYRRGMINEAISAGRRVKGNQDEVDRERAEYQAKVDEEKARQKEAMEIARQKFMKSAPKDLRGEPLRVNGLIENPKNAAFLDPEKLAKAKHYKKIGEIEAVLDHIRAEKDGEEEHLEKLIPEVEKRLVEAKNAKNGAIDAGDLEAYREHAHTVEEIQEELTVYKNRLQVVRGRFWASITPEEIAALYESLVEVTEPEVNALDAEIEERKHELRDLIEKRDKLESSRTYKWRKFYKDVCHNPELYFFSKGGFVNLGSNVVPMSATICPAYKFLQELKGGEK